MSIDSIQLEEFRALHAAIRERAAACVLLLAIGWVSWGALATAIMLVLPAAPLLVLPLVVLLAAFEANLGIARVAARLATYLRVVYEEGRAVTGWETASADLAGRHPNSVADPLFVRVFVALLSANYLCVILASGETADPSTRVREDLVDLALVTAVHIGILLRFALARSRVIANGERELERLRAATGGTQPGALDSPARRG
jgi:hypothetical protein